MSCKSSPCAAVTKIFFLSLQVLYLGPARIDYELFKQLYTYLAEVDGNITQVCVLKTFAFLQKVT